MNAPHNFLISLEERYANGIFEGTKTVELRRRTMNVAVGSTVWIYVKMPVGCVVGCATVTGLHTLAPSTLWKRFGSVSGLRRQEFFEYFSGLPKAFALSLSEPTRLSSPIPLNTLRDISSGFHPPQFFANVANDAPLLQVMNKALRTKRRAKTNRERMLELVA